MIQNKRDLGGLRTKDGKTVRPGMIVRSAQLNEAEEADLEGIASIIDLRTPGERQQMPDSTCGREYLTLPVFEQMNEGISHEEETKQMPLPDMAVLYGFMMKVYADSFRRIVLAILEHDYTKGAVLWHCTEGKDRCGMTTALILEALGVDRETILEDYLKTNLVNKPKAAALRERVLASQGKEMADAVYQAYIADEKYLRSAWKEMGSDYITGRLNIPEEKLEAFRKTVLE